MLIGTWNFVSELCLCPSLLNLLHPLESQNYSQLGLNRQDKGTEVRSAQTDDGMIDPLSVAGLTIAVLDQLWKIGEGTAQLVWNFRGFDSVRTISST